MIQFNSSSENGSTNGWMITSFILIALSIGLVGLSIWLYTSYTEQKTNVEAKIKVAENDAANAQALIDEKKFTAYENALTQSFSGPSDYGRLTFNYPRIWSTYVAKDASSGGNFEAYLNPGIVPPVSATQQFALRVNIEKKSYEDVIASYDSLVKKGDLKSSIFSANGESGTRLDGSFSKNIRGSAVIFKISDKTLTIRSDADTFKTSFDALIATIKFE